MLKWQAKVGTHREMWIRLVRFESQYYGHDEPLAVGRTLIRYPSEEEGNCSSGVRRRPHWICRLLWPSHQWIDTLGLPV